MLDFKSMKVKTWSAREKRSTDAFTRGRAGSKRAIGARPGLVVDPATRCTAQGNRQVENCATPSAILRRLKCLVNYTHKFGSAPICWLWKSL